MLVFNKILGAWKHFQEQIQRNLLLGALWKPKIVRSGVQKKKILYPGAPTTLNLNVISHIHSLSPCPPPPSISANIGKLYRIYCRSLILIFNFYNEIEDYYWNSGWQRKLIFNQAVYCTRINNRYFWCLVYIEIGQITNGAVFVFSGDSLRRFELIFALLCTHFSTF